MRKPVNNLASDDCPVLVLGLGRSGLAAARLLLQQGREVTVIDAQTRPAMAACIDGLRDGGARVETGPAVQPPPGPFAMAVVSPGIACDAPWLQSLTARGIPLVSELELGWRAAESKVLAVTGSNGKSTLAVLCHAMLEASGYGVRLGGNYGIPACELVIDYPQAEWLVLEVSSFQMETSSTFHPDIGIWLNLLPNHLDRHGDMTHYAALKARMFLNMHADDQAIIFEGAHALCPELGRAVCSQTTFGTSGSSDLRYRPGELTWTSNGKMRSLSIAGTMFDTSMLGPAAAAGLAAALAAGIAPETLATVAASQKRLAHRMEPVACIRNVEFINDAKSTNMAALKAALDAIRPPIRLLAGGRLKESDLTTVIESLRIRVISVYLWGEAARVLEKAWSGVIACRVFESLDQAVEAAWRDSLAGDSILLSPGCTSFDQYENFVARGEAFLAAVNRIKEGA